MSEEGFGIEQGVSVELEPKEKRVLPYREVVASFRKRLSWHRLRRLLNTGRVEGEKRKRKGQRGYPWVWYTSWEAVRRYLDSLKSPSEYGKMGGRGHKKETRREKVVFHRG